MNDKIRNLKLEKSVECVILAMNISVSKQVADYLNIYFVKLVPFNFWAQDQC